MAPKPLPPQVDITLTPNPASPGQEVHIAGCGFAEAAVEVYLDDVFVGSSGLVTAGWCLPDVHFDAPDAVGDHQVVLKQQLSKNLHKPSVVVASETLVVE